MLNKLMYYSAKLIRTPSIRRTIAIYLSRLAPSAPKSITDAKSEIMVAELRTRGFSLLPYTIDAATIKSIKKQLQDLPCYDIRDPKVVTIGVENSKLANKKMRFLSNEIANVAEVLDIANNRTLIQTISSYLGCMPTITSIECWWSGAQTNETKTFFKDDLYHRDAEDFKFIKLFVYLTDVDFDSGPHMFIPETHLSDFLVRRGTIEDEEIEKFYPNHSPLVITGKAGTAFLEDTWGIHRATPLQKGCRLMLAITYGITGFNVQSPKEPYVPKRHDLNSHINRKYVRT